MNKTVLSLGPGVQESLESVGGSVLPQADGTYELVIPDEARYRIQDSKEEGYPTQTANWWMFPNGDILSYLDYPYNPALDFPPQPCAHILETPAERRQAQRAGWKTYKAELGF